MEGYLQKWTNYVFGWQKRYFVLSEGILIYSEEKQESPLGTIHLDISQIFKHPKNAKRFYIDTGLVHIHLKAKSESDANLWFNTLEAHKCITNSYSQKNEVINLISEKIAEINSIHAQILAEADIIPINIIRTTPGLERAISLCEEMKDMASETLGYIEMQENYFIQPEEISFTPLKQNNKIEVLCDDTDTFVDALSQISDIEDNGPADVPYRKSLPYLRDPNQKIHIWKIIKDSIGLELSRIAVPVYFNEPLSFLQRFSEDLSYNSIILNASTCDDSTLRLAYIATFIVSTYASSDCRTMKPFNPLLGETFELCRDGFRLITEQVSHHPPISALYCEHPAYIFSASTEVKTSFGGTHLNVHPEGKNHLFLKAFGDHYVWEKPFTNVHNIIIGKIYVDHFGTVEILNENNGEKAVVEFKKRGWFSSSINEVEGIVYDRYGKEVWRIEGRWNKGMNIINTTTRNEIQAWEVYQFPENYDFNYFFSDFALQLNLPAHYFHGLPTTDSRYRPDQRCLENGDIKTATNEKFRLEEKQRAARKIMEKNNEHHVPKWFKFDGDEWKYLGGYWECREKDKFVDLPDIY
ncbi:hypothetical protein SteCoe_19236 [Stentor coeruleus]|uniref:PH domain-containing protein n=1 Tax=Stentor coeruleus TaxID=5963 RepID=A0A1R2BV01_9CILI|nr:hypothetical protein SteCoe_19236 [Stentor coeruleus]